MTWTKFGGDAARVALVCVIVMTSAAALADALDDAMVRAERGDAEGFYRLALLYERGHEAERDLGKAALYYERAAELGHVESRFALGLLSLGVLPGIPGDEARAFAHFEVAAEQGHPRAAWFMAQALERGVGVAANLERAFDWYRRAAVRGDRDAFHDVARMWASGAGIETDLVQALAWNRVAVAKGAAEARAFGKQLEARMDEHQLDEAKWVAAELLEKYVRRR